uniref:FYVE-type domain-containing protein n=1 Tax=Romanomermis culicivorax TaxID=13658 RepID=A0A915HUQ9_ROMCU
MQASIQCQGWRAVQSTKYKEPYILVCTRIRFVYKIKSEQQSKEQLEATLSDEVNTLRTELGVAKSCLEETERLRKLCDERDRQVDEYRFTINDLESALSQIKTERNKTEKLYHDCKQRSSILQQELDNSEQVQRDFVRLSQSLQIELESIRQADHQVRWQHEDDVFMCSGCKVPFSKHRRKVHCNHCGKIFCETCLTKSAPQGPMKRPAIVCDVCHTLLVHDTSPYFAHTVPNSVPSA